MVKAWIRKAGSAILTAALILTGVDTTAYAEAKDTLAIQEEGKLASEEGSGQNAEEEGDNEVLPATFSAIVTPVDGLWKYYGQSSHFVKDSDYSVSPDVEIPGMKLSIENEEIGMQRFKLELENKKYEGHVKLADNGPGFEVRAYTTAAAVQNIDVIQQTKDPVTIAAPEGYLIRGDQPKGISDEGWSDTLTTGPLQEGANEITYYLRYNKIDKEKTYKAIDLTPKTTVIQVDSIPPVITALSGDNNGLTDITSDGYIAGSEPAMYYYIALSTSAVAQDFMDESGHIVMPTPSYIRKCVESNYGINGYGRVDGVAASAIHIQSLKAETEYQIFAFLLDSAGNESDVMASNVFTTDKTLLSGSVSVEGIPEVDSTLTAIPAITSVYPGTLTYQWYRIRVEEDQEALNSVYDDTGGAAEDDLEALDDEDEEDYDDEEDEEDYDDEEYEVEEEEEVYEAALRELKKAGEDRPITSIDGADLIEGATSTTYKVTQADIGYRLICSITAENYSEYVASSTTTFVPKLMPAYIMPQVAVTTYSPKRKLSAISLSDQWSWVDSSIVPVHGNSGYRAKFVPADPQLYRTVIVRIKVPVNKVSLKRSMVSMSGTRTYTGKQIRNNFTVRYKNKKLSMKKDYKVTYKNNTRLGKATVILSGKGNYKGKLKMNYRIVAKSIQNVSLQHDNSRVYNRKPQTISLVLKNNTVRLRRNRDFTVEYQNNVEIGRAKVTICGIGNYKGKRTFRFSILPRKPKIQQVKRGDHSFRFKLAPGNVADRYYVEVSAKASFPKSSVQKYVVDGQRFEMRSLKKGVYYVRARAFAFTKSATYQSYYSNVKKIRVR